MSEKLIKQSFWVDEQSADTYDNSNPDDNNENLFDEGLYEEDEGSIDVEEWEDENFLDTDSGYESQEDVSLLNVLEEFEINDDDELFDILEGQTIIGEDEIEEDFSRRIPGSDIDEADDAPEEEKTTDWAKDGDYTKFIDYAKDKINKIPKHSGETYHGCERAKSFLKSILNEMSSAMRSDLEGAIDESEIDKLRMSIEDMTDRLDRQIKKLTGKKANLKVKLVSNAHCDDCNSNAPMWNDVENNKLVCMSCNSEENITNGELEKIAGTPVINVYVSAFERAIVGTLINSTVSAGRDMRQSFDHLKNKYSFTPQQELAIIQLVSDYGYPQILDRGNIGDPQDPASDKPLDHATNYYA